MVFESFWSEIGYVLCTQTWNLVWLLDETIFSINIGKFEAPLKCLRKWNPGS